MAEEAAPVKIPGRMYNMYVIWIIQQSRQLQAVYLRNSVSPDRRNLESKYCQDVHSALSHIVHTCYASVQSCTIPTPTPSEITFPPCWAKHYLCPRIYFEASARWHCSFHAPIGPSTPSCSFLQLVNAYAFRERVVGPTVELPDATAPFIFSSSSNTAPAG